MKKFPGIRRIMLYYGSGSRFRKCDFQMSNGLDGGGPFSIPEMKSPGDEVKLSEDSIRKLREFVSGRDSRWLKENIGQNKTWIFINQSTYKYFDRRWIFSRVEHKTFVCSRKCLLSGVYRKSDKMVKSITSCTYICNFTIFYSLLRRSGCNIRNIWKSEITLKSNAGIFRR